MKNALWKFISIVSITANLIVFLTFISRLFPQLALIIFFLIVVALIILLFFYPDIQDEDWLTKGLLILITLFAVLVGFWDFLLEFAVVHQSAIVSFLKICGILLVIFTGVGISHVVNQRFGSTKNFK